jgi:hypothetical protein
MEWPKKETRHYTGDRGNFIAGNQGYLASDLIGLINGEKTHNCHSLQIKD